MASRGVPINEPIGAEREKGKAGEVLSARTHYDKMIKSEAMDSLR